MKSYQELKVWQKSMDVAVKCYHLTKSYPKEELYGMTSQIRRSAASIPANIAEGWGRGTTKEFVHFLKIAQGSLKELETHLILSVQVMLLQKEVATPVMNLLAEISRMLIALIASLKKKKVEGKSEGVRE